MLDIIFYAGAINGFLIVLALFFVRPNKEANYYLIALVFVLALMQLVFVLQNKGLYSNYPHFFHVFDLLLLLVFPLFYLYGRSIMISVKQSQLRILVHFLPYFLMVLAHTKFYFLDGEEKIEMALHPTKYYRILEIIFNEVLSIQALLYPIATIRMIIRYKKEVQHQYSSGINFQVGLIEKGSFILFIFWLVTILCNHLLYLGILIEFDFYIFSFLSMALLIYLISYSSFRSTSVFKVDPLFFDLSEEDVDMIQSGNFKDSKTNAGGDLRRPELENIKDRLKNSMEEDQLYLNPELSLNTLADHLSVSRNKLSFVINHYFALNFHEFVNRYRVEEVKRLMSKPENSVLKMEGLGYSSGFNSKASFYRIFKQITGRSPLQYFQETYDGISVMDGGEN